MPARTAPDLQQLHHLLEALLMAPGTGRAVAETLICQAVERDLRGMMAELRARRAEALLNRDFERLEAAQMEPGESRTPWARQD